MTRTAVIALLLISLSCSNVRTGSAVDTDAPRKIVWAWERAEDLQFVPAGVGVAYLAQTLTLTGDDVQFRPRRQPLEVNNGTYLIAVTRIETLKETERRPLYSESQIEQIVDLIVKNSDRPGVRGVQIDFDVVVSERGFYRELMKHLRERLPEERTLTMTALASWCFEDGWLEEFPVADVVPMAFVMGADSERVRAFLARGDDWPQPLCRQSYGISTDEPPLSGLKPERRRYYFKREAWTRSDLKTIDER